MYLVSIPFKLERMKGFSWVKGMVGIFECMLWLIIGKNIRNNSENSNVLGIDKVFNRTV